MANTTNLDLVKPLGTDRALVAVINSNMDKIDAYAGKTDDAIGGLADGLAIIANGDTHAAITSGQFVYVRGHGSLADGLYQATANIAEDGTLSGSNLTADSSGGLNSVYSSLNGNITEVSGRMQKVHRIYPTNGARNALDVIPITKSYGSDNSVYIENDKIKFTHGGFIMINAVINASSDGNSSGRVWLKLKGSNHNLDAISYGAYGTGTFCCVQQVDTTSEIYFIAQEKMNIGSGGTASAIYVTWI